MKTRLNIKELDSKQMEKEDPQDFVRELRRFDFWRSIIAECLGSYFLLFLSSAASTSESSLEKNIPVFFGLVFLTYTFLPASGSHLNPAISFSKMCLQDISPVRAILYIGAQCAGAISGCGTAAGVLDIQIKPGITTLSDLGPEFIVAFIISIAYFHSVEQPPAEAAIFIGISHAAVLTAVDKIWLNPVRAFGPAFLANQFSRHWVVWLGTGLGFLSGGICYKFIFHDSVKEKKKAGKSGGVGGGGGGVEQPYDKDDHEPELAAPTHKMNGQVGTKPLPPLHKQDQDHLDYYGTQSDHELLYPEEMSSFQPYNTYSKSSTSKPVKRGKPRTKSCYYNLENERSLTDDELHRSSRHFRDEQVAAAGEQFSGSSSGYYSATWDRCAPERYENEEEYLRHKQYGLHKSSQLSRQNGGVSNLNGDKYERGIPSIPRSRHSRQKMESTKRAGGSSRSLRNYPIQKSYSTSY